MTEFATVEGGVTAPSGFRAAGVHAGLKTSGPDLALIVSDHPATAAGVFTSNRVQAAPVALCRDRLRSRTARAIVANSGCANACTGAQGAADAEQTAKRTAAALGIEERLVLVCSTGTIGTALPMEKIEAGIAEAVGALSTGGGPAAARAILTTDTVEKQTAVKFRMDGVPVIIGGMAKGAGMIAPDLATLLAFLTTDAAVEPAALQEALADAVAGSFNRITVDGDQSTNDTVLLLANGAAGNPAPARGSAWKTFCGALNQVTRDLAMAMVRDGEGATRFVTVTVRGARSDRDARRACRAICDSLLVKTSWFGGDPNWGRVVAAVGYSGAEMAPDRVDVWYDDVQAVRNGRGAGTDLSRLEEVLRRKAFAVAVDLHLGSGEDTAYTCDCSAEYVRINSEYMT